MNLIEQYLHSTKAPIEESAGKPDGHYLIKHGTAANNFAHKIVSGPHTKEEADAIHKSKPMGANQEHNILVRKNGRWHNRNYATGQATEHEANYIDTKKLTESTEKDEVIERLAKQHGAVLRFGGSPEAINAARADITASSAVTCLSPEDLEKHVKAIHGHLLPSELSESTSGFEVPRHPSGSEVKHHVSDNRVLTVKAGDATHKADKAGMRGDHEVAAKFHMEAHKAHKLAHTAHGESWQGGLHRDAAEHHLELSRAHALIHDHYGWKS